MKNMNYTFHLDLNPSPQDLKIITDGLTEHATTATDKPSFQPIACFARNERNEIVGGIQGYINWNWLNVFLLWVSDKIRGQGLGKKLMDQIETKAKEKGCKLAHVVTYSFQAKPFYESLGYEVFATLEDYPPGHQKFFLKKKL